jgi:hypothetical protein
MAQQSKGARGSEDKKKKFIYIGIIVVCLGGAALAYSMLSDHSRANKPEVKAAEARAQAIQTVIQEEQAKQPQPAATKSIPAESHRGSMAPIK